MNKPKSISDKTKEWEVIDNNLSRKSCYNKYNKINLEKEKWYNNRKIGNHKRLTILHKLDKEIEMILNKDNIDCNSSIKYNKNNRKLKRTNRSKE